MFAAISPMRWMEAVLTAAIHADMSWSIVTGWKQICAVSQE